MSSLLGNECDILIVVVGGHDVKTINILSECIQAAVPATVKHAVVTVAADPVHLDDLPNVQQMVHLSTCKLYFKYFVHQASQLAESMKCTFVSVGRNTPLSPRRNLNTLNTKSYTNGGGRALFK
jgi:hypothetical protein